MTEMALTPPRTARTDWRSDWRVILLMGAFCVCYSAVGLRMAVLAATEPEEPQLAWSSGADRPVRGEIVDRNGALLAANLPAWSLYAHPREIKDPVAVAEALVRIFPEMDRQALIKRLAGKRRFVWIKRPVTPRQKQLVHDLGYPGIHFGNREIRIYPAGRSVAHLMGRVKAAREEVRFAELAGSGGIEQVFDERLSDPGKAGEPLRLSIDLAVQSALRGELQAGMKRLHAKGASAVLMHAKTGEIVSMVSLPDFDPNEAPRLFRGPADENPRFNRAAQGVYELGSTFKTLTVAMAMETGVAKPDTMIKTPPSLRYGRFTIRDLYKMKPEMALEDILVKSSNVGTARVSMMVGTRRFKSYMKKLGFLERTGLEIAESRAGKPLLPPYWTDLSTMTISYGHGLAASAVHLAASYATLANGGVRVMPSLLAGGRKPGKRVFSEKTAGETLRIMREVVVRGTAKRAEVPGYDVGGKTGTAEKPSNGRYDSKRVISTFASVFPIRDPQYVLVVSLDEPEDRSGRRPVRSAGRTAVPVAADIIRRTAPILGLRPLQELPLETTPTLAVAVE